MCTTFLLFLLPVRTSVNLYETGIAAFGFWLFARRDAMTHGANYCTPKNENYDRSTEVRTSFRRESNIGKVIN